MKTSLTVNAKIQIAKPASEVFEAIVNSEQMTHYFISKASGPMEEGKTLLWQFPEFPDDYPVRVGKMQKDKLISFSWDTDGKEYLVEINLTSKGDTTIVSVTESGGTNDEAGIKWLKGNTEGWANFLACLKAWLEYGINLRKGAFDFYKKT